MSQSFYTALPEEAYPADMDVDAPALLSKLVYRSRGVKPLSSMDLYKMALAAQSRNRAERVTGLVLYDQGSFFQWLEGPEDSLARVMQSIRNDSRHTDIEVLDSQPTSARIFTGWSMKLATAGHAEASLRQDVMEPPPGIIERLRRDPRAAPILLAALMPVPAGMTSKATTEVRESPRTPFNHHAAAILKTVIIETVIPELADRHGVLPAGSLALPMDKRVGELVELLIGADQSGAVELIREVQAGTVPALLHYGTLFEPAARKLGDLWGEDVCTEFDVAIGLSRLQTAVRLLSAGVAHRPAPRMPTPYVLIAPEPGELHSLGVTLDAEVIWQAGWNAHCEFPQDDHALEDLVAATWFDVLDLSLSSAFRREHSVARMKKTVAAARLASRNPAMLVVVGGRLFAEHGAIGAQVGADSASTTAVRVDQSIMDRLRKDR